MEEKTRYSDAELQEFKEIIDEKLRLARRDYDEMMRQLMNADGNDCDDTSPTYKVLEEGSATQSKEELIQLANRQPYKEQDLRYRPHQRQTDTEGAPQGSTSCHTQCGVETQ